MMMKHVFLLICCDTRVTGRQ